MALALGHLAKGLIHHVSDIRIHDIYVTVAETECFVWSRPRALTDAAFPPRENSARFSAKPDSGSARGACSFESAEDYGPVAEGIAEAVFAAR